jgi:hypothetical protein
VGREKFGESRRGKKEQPVQKINESDLIVVDQVSLGLFALGRLQVLVQVKLHGRIRENKQEEVSIPRNKTVNSITSDKLASFSIAKIFRKRVDVSNNQSYKSVLAWCDHHQIAIHERGSAHSITISITCEKGSSGTYRPFFLAERSKAR